MAAGALHPNGNWIRSRRGFLFPVKALSSVFRGKFMAGLKLLLQQNVKLTEANAELTDARARQHFFDALHQKPWVVYAKPPFGGPDQVLDYLGRYTHRVAISNHRLLSVDDGDVRFRYKDYAHGNQRKVMTLAAPEFIRRFLLHVLPAGFMRIRHYGLIANRAKREKLAQALTALNHPAAAHTREPESVEAFWLRIARLNVHLCPHCKVGRMRVVAPIPAQHARAPPPLP